MAGSSGAATVLDAPAQGGNTVRGPRPGSRVSTAFELNNLCRRPPGGASASACTFNPVSLMLAVPWLGEVMAAQLADSWHERRVHVLWVSTVCPSRWIYGCACRSELLCSQLICFLLCAQVGRAELAGLEMLDSAMLGAGRTSRSARNAAGTAPVLPAAAVAQAAAAASAAAAQQTAGKPAGGLQSRKRKAAAVDGPVPVTEAGEGPAEADVAAAAAKAPARKGKKASGKAKRVKQGPVGNRKAGSAGVSAAESAEAVAAQPAKRTKSGVAGSQQTADVEMTDAAPTEAAAAAAPPDAAPATSVASQAAAAPAEGAAEPRRGTRRRQQVVLLSPGAAQASPLAPVARAAVPAAAAAQSLAAAAAASGLAAAEPMQVDVPGPVLGVSKAGRLRKASAKASAAREVPLARQGSARGQGRRSAHPEKPQAQKAPADKAPQAARAAQAEEGSAAITAPVLVAPLEQVGLPLLHLRAAAFLRLDVLHCHCASNTACTVVTAAPVDALAVCVDQAAP